MTASMISVHNRHMESGTRKYLPLGLRPAWVANGIFPATTCELARGLARAALAVVCAIPRAMPSRSSRRAVMVIAMSGRLRHRDACVPALGAYACRSRSIGSPPAWAAGTSPVRLQIVIARAV